MTNYKILKLIYLLFLTAFSIDSLAQSSSLFASKNPNTQAPQTETLMIKDFLNQSENFKFTEEQLKHLKEIIEERTENQDNTEAQEDTTTCCFSFFKLCLPLSTYHNRAYRPQRQERNRISKNTKTNKIQTIKIPILTCKNYSY